MQAYHDNEWGTPHRDEPYLFELLLLECMQAGLSWSTVLAKRPHYRLVLDGFDPRRIARYGQRRLDKLMQDPGIIRNRLKVRALVTNAQAFLTTQEEQGSFARYLWAWVDDKPIVRQPRRGVPLAPRSELSEQVSRDLKKRGFSFVGSTTVQAYLQAVGIFNDHVVGCPAGTPPQDSNVGSSLRS